MARNAWEVAWNMALDRTEQQKRKEESSDSEIDPYQEAWKASDLKRIELGIPCDEWNYERCERYTLVELENLKRLREWGRKYMSEEQSYYEQRELDRVKRPKTG